MANFLKSLEIIRPSKSAATEKWIQIIGFRLSHDAVLHVDNLSHLFTPIALTHLDLQSLIAHRIC